MKKYKKFCFLGIGLLPLVLASCGINTATKDSQDVTEKSRTGSDFDCRHASSKLRPSYSGRPDKYYFISQCDGRLVSIR